MGNSIRTGTVANAKESPKLSAVSRADFQNENTALREYDRARLKCDGTCAETRFGLSAKRTSPFKSRGVTSVQSTAGSRGVRISGSNAGYTMFRGSVKSTGYPLHSYVFPSFPLPGVIMCHHVSTGVYTEYTEDFTSDSLNVRHTVCVCAILKE